MSVLGAVLHLALALTLDVGGAAAPSPGATSATTPPAAAPRSDATAGAVDGGAEQRTLGEMRGFIFDKLGYDLEYFEKVAATHGQGRILAGFTRATWPAEVKRAQLNLPVLKRFAAEREDYEKRGRPFTLPKDASLHKEYRNLLALLDMFQAQATRPADVVAVGDTMRIKSAEDFGRVRGARADFYVSMYRAYYFLMGSAHYALRNDAQAVAWFARLTDDAKLAKLREKVAAVAESPQETKALELDQLRAKPVAVLPFENLTRDAALAYVSSSLVEVITTDIVQTSDLVVVERGQLDKVMGEVALELGGMTAGGAVAKAGGLTGAGTVLVGAVAREGDRLLVTMRLVAVEGERALAAASTAVPEAELFAGARRALVDVLARVGWDAGMLTEELFARHAPSVGTAKMLHEARLMRATRQDEARKLFAQALKEDPALANLYKDLKAEFGDLTSTLAVLPFTNLSGRGEDAWVSRAVVEALNTDLTKVGFTLVERARVDELLAEQLGAEGFVDARSAARVGTLLGADYVLLGSALVQSPSLRLDARVVETRSGVVAFAAAAENKRDDIGAAILALTTQIGERFNQPLPPEEQEQLAATKLSTDDFKTAARARLSQAAFHNPHAVAAAAGGGGGAPLPWRSIARWTAVGAVGVGAVAAMVGVVVAEPSSDRANQLHGLQLAVEDPATRSELRRQRDDAANAANVGSAVAVAGGAVLVAGAGGLVVDALLAGE